MSKKLEIKEIKAREILCVAGTPTVEVVLTTVGGARGKASVESGTSVGSHEAIQLRDGGDRFFGLGVRKAVKNVNEVIAPKLLGMDVTRQKEIDELLIQLDGTPNKSRLGANAILGVSVAAVKAAAAATGVPLYKYMGGTKSYFLPVPMFTVIHGGISHPNKLDIEDFVIAPIDFDSFAEALEAGVEVYYELYKILEKDHFILGGDAFVPQMSTSREALDAIMKALKATGYENKFMTALDSAADGFYDRKEKTYDLDGKKFSEDELIDYYRKLAADYPMLSIEDPFYEDGFEGFAKLLKILKNVQIVGDDLFASNKERLKYAIEHKAANGIVLKPNQVGTVTETMETARIAHDNGFAVLPSIRTKNAGDLFIADLGVAAGGTQIKIGSPSGCLATLLYNRLVEIEEELGDSEYAGKMLKRR